MYGEDKTSLEELKNTVNELQSLKIEILPKADKISDLNDSIEKMENQIKQVDESLLNNTQFVTTGSETSTENTTEEQQEIKTTENSNLNILISNIDTLTEKVNQAVKVETERKAEEERKAKELEAKKVYAGTYKNNQGKTETITINENGELYYKNHKIDLNFRYNGASLVYESSPYDFWYLIPIGKKINDVYDNSGNLINTDTNKIRLTHEGNGALSISDVYYKVD